MVIDSLKTTDSRKIAQLHVAADAAPARLSFLLCLW